MTEIMNMSYWQFKGILRTFDKKKHIESGKPYTEQGLPQSSKDMIDRLKEMKKKERSQVNNGE